MQEGSQIYVYGVLHIQGSIERSFSVEQTDGVLSSEIILNTRVGE